MRVRFVVCLVAVSLVVPIPQRAQQPVATAPIAVTRDAQAVALLQSSVAAMGTTMPSDSTASGNVEIVAGSLTSHGTIQLRTRGANQTSVQFETDSSNWSVIYSNGQANRVETSATTNLSLEQAASSQCVYFPLPFVSELLNNPDVSIRSIGLETLGSSQAMHLRTKNTFNSSALNQFLSDFSVVDIWLDVTSGLPLQISFVRRTGGGSAPKIPISISYSNYQSFSGVQYPLSIEESVNGTVWATISINSVAFNTGLVDGDFAVSVGAN